MSIRAFTGSSSVSSRSASRVGGELGTALVELDSKGGWNHTRGAELGTFGVAFLVVVLRALAGRVGD